MVTKRAIMDKLNAFILLLIFTNIVDAAKVSNCTNGVITLACPTTSGCVLKIGGATFGHGDTSSNCTLKDNDCMTNASFVWEMCAGKDECSVKVPQERPRQGCKTVSTYLTVEFDCVCVSCKALPALPAQSGVVRYSSPYMTPNTSATYHCREGYSLIGPMLRICQQNGTWSGVQPACSVPLSSCPSSVHSQTAFGSKCYEVVSTVANWETAENDCQTRNGTLLLPEGEGERKFLEWQLEKLKVYNYIWLASSAMGTQINKSKQGNLTGTNSNHNDKECQELHRPDTSGSTWQQQNTSCSYMNSYICTYEIDPALIHIVPKDSKFQYSKTGIGLGIGVGIILILLGLFYILCRERENEETSLPDKVKAVDQDFANQESEIDIYDDTTYDDTLPECDVTPSPSPVIEKYAQVDKSKKTNGHQNRSQSPPSPPPHSDYDEVYSTMNAEIPKRNYLPQSNTYENVTVHHLVGSLKKKLTRPWRNQTASHRVTVEEPPELPSRAPGEGPPHGGTTAVGVGKSGKAVARRNKPQPAPKPAMRKSALEARLEAIRAGKERKRSENGRRTPEIHPSVSPNHGLRREGTEGRRGSRPEGVHGGVGQDDRNIQSGIEIVENEIYDSDDQYGKLTEL